jgi:hypothetical protein
VDETGCGPEGIQLLTITHKHFQTLMNDRKMPFIALADYAVAPYGYNDLKYVSMNIKIKPGDLMKRYLFNKSRVPLILCPLIFSKI